MGLNRPSGPPWAVRLRSRKAERFRVVSRFTEGQIGGIMLRNRTVTILAAALVMLGSRLNAVDFIRGDTNSDGKVSVSDSKFLLNFLFRPGSEAGCLSALDTNGDRV